MSISSHRSLVSPPCGFSGMDKHRGLGRGGGLPSMGPPCRPHQRLKVVHGGVSPPSALGAGNTVTGRADRGKETGSSALASLSHSDQSLKVTPPLDFPGSGAKSLPSLFRPVSIGFSVTCDCKHNPRSRARFIHSWRSCSGL